MLPATTHWQSIVLLVNCHLRIEGEKDCLDRCEGLLLLLLLLLLFLLLSLLVVVGGWWLVVGWLLVVGCWLLVVVAADMEP